MELHSLEKTVSYEGSLLREGKAFFFSASFLLFVALFFFIHMRELKVPMLELGVVSSKYVVTDVPFSFNDEEATVTARQESLLDVGKIFSIDAEDIAKRGAEFDNSLIYESAWRAALPQATFDMMCQENAQIKKIFHDIRFSDVRTIEKMKQLGLNTELFYEVVPFDVQQGIYFPDKVWNFIKQRVMLNQTTHDAAIVEYILGFYRGKIWTVKEDHHMVRDVRAIVQRTIPNKYTTIEAGSTVVQAGERVSLRHLAMIRAMKNSLSDQKHLWNAKVVTGSLFLTMFIFLTLFFFLRRYQAPILRSRSQYGLFVTICIVALASAKLCEFFLGQSQHFWIDMAHYPLLTPFVGILLCALFNNACALFLTTFFAILFDTCLSFDSEGFLLANILVSYAVIFPTKTLHKRKEIVSLCLRGWCVASVLIVSFYLYNKLPLSVPLFSDISGACVWMILSAVVVLGLLPFFETSFKILTDINLMEFMDPNNELLRRLMIEAPGTYQHVVIMGGIAEAAAQSIGCNGLFCRVASLYHDIGKIPISQYFTENQQNGVNIHQHLTPQESVKIITSHVVEGSELARQAGLPKAFIDIIKEHHGTSRVYYFYRKFLDENGLKEGDIDDSSFRYDGPLPHSKESGIIMIADAFEAASRSLNEITPEKLTVLIEQLVREKLDDGQLDECQLTCEELSIIKKTMVKALLSIGHVRVKYPERTK